MKFGKQAREARETATISPAETATALMLKTGSTRAPVRVIRDWPGVVIDQLVILSPDREARLLRTGFVEPL